MSLKVSLKFFFPFLFNCFTFVDFLMLLLSSITPAKSITFHFLVYSLRPRVLHQLNPQCRRILFCLWYNNLYPLWSVSLFIVIDFLVLGSIRLRSFLVHFKNDQEYLIRWTAQLFLPWLQKVFLFFEVLFSNFFFRLFVW